MWSPTNSNQTESGAGQSIPQCCQKSPQPTSQSCERHKGMQTERASLGWVKQRTQDCKYGSRHSSSKLGSGKGTQTDSCVYETLLPENLGKHCWEWQAKWSQRSSFSFRRTANCKTRSVLTEWLSNQRSVRVWFHWQARCIHHPQRQCRLYGLNLQLDKSKVCPPSMRTVQTIWS